MHPIIPALSGTPASAFGFGTMQFGQGSPEAECPAIYAACREAGINLFDTAFGYTNGASEQILGRLIAPERENLVIMTKCAHPGPSDRATLNNQIDTSRQRLGIDVIDVLFLHRWDANTALEETFATLAEQKTRGVFRSLGVSNFAAWQVIKAGTIAAQFDLTIDVIQPMYNLVKRQAEVELLPMASSEGIAVTPYSPVAGGLLSGKYASTDANGRIKENPEYAARYSEGWVHDIADSFVALAHQAGVNPVTLAVAWVAANPDISAPLISGRTLEQLRPSLAALDYTPTPDLFAATTQISRTPPPATDRLEEQLTT